MPNCHTLSCLSLWAETTCESLWSLNVFKPRQNMKPHWKAWAVQTTACNSQIDSLTCGPLHQILLPSNGPFRFAILTSGDSKILLQPRKTDKQLQRPHPKVPLQTKVDNHFYCILGQLYLSLSPGPAKPTMKKNKPNPLPLQAACPTERTMCSMVGSTQEQVKTAEAQVAVIGKCLNIQSAKTYENIIRISCSMLFLYFSAKC